MDVFFFWLFAAGMIGFSLAVVLGRNPVASALCFATSMIFMAALFVMLNAFFLAAVQILVTAGAVMVLFLFIIMLLDIGAMSHLPRQKVWMGVTLVCSRSALSTCWRACSMPIPNGGDDQRLPARMFQQPLHAWPKPELRPNCTKSKRRPAQKPSKPGDESNDDTHRIGRLLFTQLRRAL